MYSRLEAMKVAKEQALVREKAANYVKDGREVPQDLMMKYKKTIQQKLDPGGRRSAARQKSQQEVAPPPQEPTKPPPYVGTISPPAGGGLDGQGGQTVPPPALAPGAGRQGSPQGTSYPWGSYVPPSSVSGMSHAG